MKELSLIGVMLMLFSLFFIQQGNAQNGTDRTNFIQQDSSWIIKGQVLDGETEEALIGYSIFVRKYQKGVYTDLNGNFAIEVDDFLESDHSVELEFPCSCFHESISMRIARSDFSKVVAIKNEKVLDLGRMKLHQSAAGCYFGRRPPLHKRIWYTIKGWFRW